MFRKTFGIVVVVVVVVALVCAGWYYHDSALADTYAQGFCEGLGNIYTIDRNCVDVHQ